MNRQIKCIETGFLTHASAMRTADALIAAGRATQHIYAARRGNAGWCLYDVS